MRVLIIGGTGLVGSALAASYASDGHEVVVLTRHLSSASTSHPSIRAVQWDGRSTDGWGHLVDGAGAIVNLAGETIGGTHLGQVFFQRWSTAKKRRILESRTDAGRALMEAIGAAERKPSTLLQMSAVGYYGPRPDRDVDERAPAGSDFLASVCVAWERSTEAVEAMGIRRVVVRTGLVLSTSGGLFPVVLLPFRMFVGGRLGGGDQGFSWIHADDQRRALRWLIESEDLHGTFNLTAPEPVSMAELGRLVAGALHRPYWFPTPAFLLRLVLGQKAMLVLKGQFVQPRRLLEAGFTYRYPTLESALDSLLGGD